LDYVVGNVIATVSTKFFSQVSFVETNHNFSFIDKKMNESAKFDINKAAGTITEEFTPKKPRKIYEQQYEGFSKWRMEKRVENYRAFE
jgi:hypothetical protein